MVQFRSAAARTRAMPSTDVARSHHHVVAGGDVQHLQGLRQQLALLITDGQETGQAGLRVIPVLIALIGLGLQGGEPDHAPARLGGPLYRIRIQAAHRAVQGHAACYIQLGELRHQQAGPGRSVKIVALDGTARHPTLRQPPGKLQIAVLPGDHIRGGMDMQVIDAV